MADKILVRMMTMAAGPHFQHPPGAEVALDAELAETLIDGGYALRVESAPVEQKAQEAPATRDELAVGPVETATAPPQRSSEADDLVTAERGGWEAASADRPRVTPADVDGRSAAGRAWLRGYDMSKRKLGTAFEPSTG